MNSIISSIIVFSSISFVLLRRILFSSTLLSILALKHLFNKDIFHAYGLDKWTLFLYTWNDWGALHNFLNSASLSKVRNLLQKLNNFPVLTYLGLIMLFRDVPLKLLLIEPMSSSSLVQGHFPKSLVNLSLYLNKRILLRCNTLALIQKLLLFVSRTKDFLVHITDSLNFTLDSLWKDLNILALIIVLEGYFFYFLSVVMLKLL